MTRKTTVTRRFTSRSAAATHPSPPDRDVALNSLLVAFGKMTEGLLRAGHRDAKFLERLVAWRSSPLARDSSHLLVSTSIDGATIFVLAHGGFDEFCVLLNHPAATVVASATFDQTTEHLMSLHLAEAHGNRRAAIDYCLKVGERRLLFLEKTSPKTESRDQSALWNVN